MQRRVLGAEHPDTLKSVTHFARALERLRKDQDDGLAKVLKYLDTHPDIDARIEKARLHARSLSATTARAFDLDWQQLKRALPTVF